MATHRRGLRPAQWPVRDLLSEQRPRIGALRDPRLYAAVGGLLACGAAATVAFTASDGGPGRNAAPGPMALPAPNTVAPAPADPGPSDPNPSGRSPSRSGGGSAGGTGSGPVPRAWRLPADKVPATVAVPKRAARDARSASVREIADRVAAELVRMQARPRSDGTVEGLLVVPEQRGGTLTARFQRVPVDAPSAAAPERTGGRHRALDSDDRERPGAHRKAEHEESPERADRDDDAEREHDRKRDRDDREHDQYRDDDRAHDDRTLDDDRDRDENDRDDDRKDDCERADERDERKHDRDSRDDDGEHDRGGRHAQADDADDSDDETRDDETRADPDESADDRSEAAPSTRSAAARPAMAIAAHDRGADLGKRTIDPDALLAALADF